MDFSSLSAKARGRALDLALRQSSPFADIDYCVAWRGGEAAIWLWDAGKVAARFALHGVGPRVASLIPETLLQAPRQSGAALRRCLDGVEGQLWEGGMLRASRWWPQSPSAEAWRQFARHAGMAADTECPALGARDCMTEPWLSPTSRADILLPQWKSERWVLTGVALCLGWYAVWLSHAQIDLWRGERAVHAQAAALQQRALRVVSARDAAQRDQQIVQQYAALLAYPNQATMMAAVLRTLGRDGTTLHAWNFQHGKLKMGFNNTMRDIAASELIERLQALPQFAKLQVVPQSNAQLLDVTVEVKPLVTHQDTIAD